MNESKSFATINSDSNTEQLEFDNYSDDKIETETVRNQHDILKKDQLDEFQLTKKKKKLLEVNKIAEGNFTSPRPQQETKNNLQVNQAGSFHPSLFINDEVVFSQEQLQSQASSKKSNQSDRKLLNSQSNYLEYFQEESIEADANLSENYGFNRHSNFYDSQQLDLNGYKSINEKSVQPQLLRQQTEQFNFNRKQKNTPKKEPNLSNETNSEQTRRQNNQKKQFNKKLLRKNEEIKQQYLVLAAEKYGKILDSFQQQFPEIMTLNSRSQNNNMLAIFWSKILLLVYLYNYFTCIWFLAFSGFPKDFWYALEVLAELISFVDLLLVVIFPRFLPKEWQIMLLLHQTSDDQNWFNTKLIISSVPTSIILSGALRYRPSQLKHFGVACTRILKFFRYRKFEYYFDRQMLSKYEFLAWMVKITEIILSFLFGMHFIISVFIMPSRFQDGYGWFKLVGYYDYGLFKVPRWQIYLDSTVYVVSNMSGMGFGNNVPQANGEWFASCVVLTMGASIYKNYFRDFSGFAYAENQKTMQNQLDLERYLQYAKARQLPDELRQKINYFFKNLRIPFDEFNQRKKIIKELPVSLKEDISLLIYYDLIKEVKFFQVCPNEFILKLCSQLKNQICMINEHVFWKDEAAKHFYLINEGVCELVASDEQTLIRFMSKGAFFGEIGCLLTGKRSCSVIVRTTTILHKIKKDQLNSILQAYPSQYRYLKAIGRQRLQTTDPQEIEHTDDYEINLISEQIQQLENSYTVFGSQKNQNNTFDNLPKLQAEFAQNMQKMQKKNIFKFVNMITSTISSRQLPLKRQIKAINMISQQSNQADEQTSFIQSMWHTSQFKPGYFAIIPWSPLFLIWNFILAVVVFYDTWMVLFSLCFKFDIKGTFLALDIIIIIILALDIPIRAHTAVTNSKYICLDRDKVLNYYLNNWLLLDIIAFFPVCYFLMISPNIRPVYIALARLPRVLKIFRINESINMLKWNSNISHEYYDLFQLILLYFFTGHLIACGFAVIGKNDYGRKQRFDNLTLFKYSENVEAVRGITDKFLKLSPWGLYQQMFYLGFGILNCCVYGDLIPFSPLEQIFDIVAQVWSQVIWAFIAYEFGCLIGQIYNIQAEEISKRDQIVFWMQQNQVPNQLIARYKDYHACNSENLQGIQVQQMLKKLPHSLRTEIKSYMFKEMIQNWETFSNESQGTINTLISMLKIQIYPKNVYIITAGEIAKEMYFIEKGVIEIRGVNNELLNTLKQGQNFGEMALLVESNPIRMANAVSQTIASLAVLTKEDFDKLCEFVPKFREQMMQQSEFRMVMNKQTYEQIKLTVKPINQTLEVIHEASESVISVQEQKLRQIYQANLLSQNHIFDQAPQEIQFEKSFEEIYPIVNPNIVHEEEKMPSTQQPATNYQSSRGLIDQSLQTHQLQGIANRDININGNFQNQSNLLVNRFERKLDNISIRGLPEKSETIFTEASSDKGNLLHQEDMDSTLRINQEILIRNDQDINRLKSNDKSSINFQSPRQNMHRKSIGEHFEILNAFQEQEAKYDNTTLFMRIVQAINMGLVFYNLLFIPLQFAYRIKFKGVFLALEIVTIGMYLTEIGLRINMVVRLNQLKNQQLAQLKNLKDPKLLANQYSLQQKIDKQIFEIIVTSVAVLPLSLLLQLKGQYSPFGWLVLLQSLRLIKLRPVNNFWQFNKKYALHFATMMQRTFLYYYASHFFACIIIGMAIFNEDHRKTWLKKLPAPKQGDLPQTSSVFDRMSPLHVYNSALYYLVNTISNLSIGDVSMINPQERFLNGFICLFCAFFYNSVSVCNFTIVRYLVTGKNINYFENSYDILTKIDNGKVTKSTIDSVRGFFDFIWYSNRGIEFDQLRQNLPVSISADLSLNIFKNAIERSYFFCDQTGKIDMPLVISVFKQIQFKRVLSSHFVVKVGEFTDDTLILLEGQLRVYGLADNQLLGVLTRGSHYGLDLSDDFSERDEILKFDKRVNTEFKMDYASDNFDSRSIINLVSSSIVTLGILKKKDRDILYHAFPEFKRRVQFMNRVLFMLGKTSLEQHTKQNKFQNSKYYCKKLQLDHIMYTKQDSYKDIIDQNLHSDNNNFDLSIFLKKALMLRSREVQHIEDDEAFNKNILKSHLDPSCNFDSNGIQVIKQKKTFRFHSHKRDSTLAQINRFMQFFNCLYIAIMIPFEVGFEYPMNKKAITFEAISLGLQIIYIVIKLRIQIIVKGRYTVRLKYVLTNYMNEGLIIDIFGLLPFNLIFGYIYPSSSIKLMPFVLLITFVRLLRVVTALRISELIDELDIYFKQASYYIILIKAVVIWFITGHIMTSSWYFYCSQIQRNYVKHTWPIQQQLLDKSLAEKYLRSYYFMLNIATGVGSGDMVPQNEGERLYISILLCSQDMAWSFGFGLLVYFYCLQKIQKNKKDLEDKINQMQKLMETIQDQNFQKQRMEKYFAYLMYQQQNSWLVDKNELLQHLPVSVVQEIVVQTNEEIFQNIFKNINSENLIRDLCLNLDIYFFLPQDFIAKRGDIANQVFFVVDGTVYILGHDQKTILVELNQGEYFGEIAVLSNTKRKNDFQAANFCLLYSLSKQKFEELSIFYPQLRQHLQETGTRKQQQIDLKQDINQEKSTEEDKIDKLLPHSFVSDQATYEQNQMERSNYGQNPIERSQTNQIIFSRERSHMDSVEKVRQRRNSFEAFEMRFLNDASQPSFKNIGTESSNEKDKKARRRSQFVSYESNLINQPRKNSFERFDHISENNEESFAIPENSKSKTVSSKRRLSDCSLQTHEHASTIKKKLYGFNSQFRNYQH